MRARGESRGGGRARGKDWEAQWEWEESWEVVEAGEEARAAWEEEAEGGEVLREGRDFRRQGELRERLAERGASPCFAEATQDKPPAPSCARGRALSRGGGTEQGRRARSRPAGARTTEKKDQRHTDAGRSEGDPAAGRRMKGPDAPPADGKCARPDPHAPADAESAAPMARRRGSRPGGLPEVVAEERQERQRRVEWAR